MASIDIQMHFARGFEGELRTQHASAAIGKGEGRITPYEFLLGALGSCFYSTFVDIADKMRLQYERAELSISGTKRTEVPTTLEHATLRLTIVGAPEQKGFDRAVELAGKYCSVHATLSMVADIQTELHFA